MGQPLTRVPCWAFQRPKTTDGHRRNAAVFLHRAPAKSPRGLRAPPLPDLETLFIGKPYPLNGSRLSG